MFGRTKRGPSKPFIHQEGCRIVKADPGVEIQWSELERGRCRATCVCGTEEVREPVAGRVRRNDSYDPATARHLPQCEYVSESDPDVLRLLLKVKPGLGQDYDWVECGACAAAWPVPHYAESVR